LCAAIWHPLTINFLRLLIEKRRLPILAEIARRVNELLRESRGILAVKLTLALAPAPAQLAALRERLARIFERQVELETAVDPELLGGIVIQAADRLVDGSCRGQLDRIRTELAVT
jgi:F-type H+-transporting ATPase subunit delta